jgi:hypothetical protein
VRAQLEMQAVVLMSHFEVNVKKIRQQKRAITILESQDDICSES